MNKLLTIFLITFMINNAYTTDDDIRVNNNRYDYIIVGSGSAGGVIAGRLSENPNIKVLLIERGRDESFDPTVVVPTVNSVLLPVDIRLLPVETVSTFEPLLASRFNYLVVPFAQGGGPAVSGSFWGRGEPKNYDDWAQILGDNNYTYANLLPYFKATENVALSDSNSTDRGRNGPIQITFLNPNESAVNSLVELQKQVFNTTYNIDYATSQGLEGIWPMQRSLKRSAGCTPFSGPCERQSAYDTYIKPYLLNRTNLDVISGGTALKLNLRTKKNKTSAEGVDYLLGDRVYRAKADNEVIVSLGTLNSPKFLQLSGIGDFSHLTLSGITGVVNLPGVGKHLEDHLATGFAYYLPTAETIVVPASIRISFFKSGLNGDNIDVEIAWGLIPTAALFPPPFPSGSVLAVFVIQLKNTSGGGSVDARSPNPFERPDIQYNFDINRLSPMVWGIKKVQEWINPIGIQLSPAQNILPPTANDMQIFAYLSQNVNSYYHPTGTCKMAKLSDPLGVVDTKFKVRGVESLRVIDNSIMPSIVSTHPSATASMLGELGAKLILDDYN